MQINVKLQDSKLDYTVFIDELTELKFDTKVCVITNQKVAGLHLKSILDILVCKELSVICVSDGEEYKNFDTINHILEQMFLAKLDRNSIVIALGGGVVTDMAGFAAGIYERGIKLINIPTTLLAQVDASVGGKTGINNKFGKNLIGIFNQPMAVYCQSKFLQTLPKRELYAGLAEAIKMAVMFDREFFEFLKNIDTLKNENLVKIISKCIELKANVVSKDEFENGIRSVLNYGHTFGHVIENQTKYKKYLHGEAVSIGMNMANELALKMGFVSKEYIDEIRDVLEKFSLPTTYKVDDENEFYEAFFLDKKSKDSKIKFVLPDEENGFRICDDIHKVTVCDVLEKFQ